MNNQKIPTLVAHRGYRERYPENSWLGLKAALDSGACWLEFDVQMCADETFIMMHDVDLSRTAGINRSVFDIDATELEKISVHQPARFGNGFYPTGISTLDDVLAKLSNYPQASYMVEIKEESLGHWGLAAVMDKLFDKLQPYRKNSVLISFNYAAMEYAKKNSDLRIGLVLEKYNQKAKDKAMALNPDFLICNQRKLPGNKPPWAGSWEWVLYEINSSELALAWVTQGVNYIETGDIGTMTKDPILATKACKHGV